MRKLLLFLCLLVAIINSSACTAEQDPNVIKVSKSSDEIVGENYQTVISELGETGFTNIETKVLDDLITSLLTNDGEIEQVEINGDTEFSANDSFQKDSKIVITYHTFPKEEKSDTESADEKSYETVDQPTNDTSVESNQEILTVKNNEDLSAVLAVKDEFHAIVGEFAKKYAGRTIEFDGNTAAVNNHGDYKTRFDYLIYAGDYSKTTFSGPYFQFRNVNYYDLHLTGENVPDIFGVGLNIHIIATVEEYSETSGLFQLKPVSIKMR
jgi:hypothetical protein